MSRPAGLGRGLSALLGDLPREEPASGGGETGRGPATLPVGEIEPNPDQPRRRFDDASMAELADSIAARGLLQPIVVRPRGGRYQIVAGERRWRAAQRVGLHEIPVVIKDIPDSSTLELALVENIQRQDLNPIEEASSYQRLMRDFGHSQDELGRIVNKSRSHVANLVRLLDLPAPVRDMVAEGRLSMGHARALVTAADPLALAHQVEAQGLSVRQTEELARADKGVAKKPRGARGKPANEAVVDADVAALERQLGDTLGLRVQITHSDNGGTVTINYSTLDQLDMLCQRMSGEPI
jgi:ParB family chromosome partitioning protein